MRAGLAIATLLALAGCDTPGNQAATPPPPTAKAIARTVLESEDSARFRMAARQLFAALDTPRCKPLGGSDRTAQLKPERAATTAFKERLGTTGAAFQLAVARADVEFQPGCRDGSDQQYVARARRDVADSLAVMQRLLPSLDQVPVSEPIPARSAEFRDRVRRLATVVQPPCSLAQGATNDVILAPALEAVRQFQAGLPDAVHRHHYAIAKADVDLEQSMAIVECVMPSRDAPGQVRDKLLAEVRRQIAALEAIRL